MKSFELFVARKNKKERCLNSSRAGIESIMLKSVSYCLHVTSNR